MDDTISEYMQNTRASAKFWKQALKVIPGGVTANIKYFEPYPVFMKRAKGSRICDVDGNEYVDFCLSLGPLILGHGHPAVTEAIKRQLEDCGTTIFGTPHELEIKMAKEVRNHVPCAEMVRFVNSGLEATLQCLRLARAYTKKAKIAKFEGHYHGAHDFVAISTSPPLDLAGPEDAPKAVPDSAGLPKSIVDNTLVLPFNDAPAVERIIEKNKNELAAVILEPVMRGFLPPEKGFLRSLRTVTEENGVMLIFDEIMTGFRLGLGGAQKLFGVTPDMVALGKVVGGGLPVGMFAGKAEIMEQMSPARNKFPHDHVFQSGTFSGCPTVLAAGLATMDVLKKPGTYEHIEWVAEQVRECMRDSFENKRIDARVIGVGSMFQCLFTSSTSIRNYRDVAKADARKRTKFDIGLINGGVYVRPCRTYYTSLAHTPDDLEITSKAIEKAANAIREA